MIVAGLAAGMGFHDHLGAQSNVPTRISVRVIDAANESTLPDVQIQLVGSQTRPRLASDGAFVIDVMGQRSDTAVLVVRQVGFEAQTIRLALVSATVNTIVRLRRIVALPVEEVVASGVSPDLLQKLKSVGFLERRTSSAAPASSFITDADIKRWKPTLVSHITARLGRSLGGCTTYVDGVQVNTASGPKGTGLRRGIDALLLPSEIAAVEVYRRMSEVPTRFAATGRAQCVILYWLR